MASISFVNRGYSHKKKRAKLSVAHKILPEFDSGDDWESYSKQLEEHFAGNSIADDKQVAVLLTVVSPSVYEVLRDACHPELPQLRTYAQLSKLLETHYSQQALVFEERITFLEAVQADDESVNDWLARVMSLAVFCEFDEQLDIMLRDKFISGLADKSMVNRLCTENCTTALTMRNIVDIALQMESTMQRQLGQAKSSYSKQQKLPQRSRVTNILDIPDELLIEIILHLNARERVPLGNTCQRFNNLVFKDEKLLKDLDFSKNGYLTSLSDIQQYFCNGNTVRSIRRVNLRDVSCLKPPMLHISIGKAMNLVDIDIQGTVLKDIWELATFLNPFQQLRRLSIDWPPTKENNISFCHQVLRGPFSRVTYLSVNLAFDLVKTLLTSLQLCQELRELCIDIDEVISPLIDELGNEELEKLRNLEIVQYCGLHASHVKNYFVTLLPDLEKWTHFELRSSLEYDNFFYLEKNTEICTELAASKCLANVQHVGWSDRHSGRVVFPESLLEAVLKITHEHVPDQLCCLSTFVEGYRCLLNITDTKGLVKNPRHPISCLDMNHDIERGCDVHLIACAFPSLTELYLSNIITNKLSNRNEPHSSRCLKKKGTTALEKQEDSMTLDSSFKMLVDHTPHLKHLTVQAGSITKEECCWDLEALYLIPNWQYLETLCLWNVPIEHGEFLIEIGKGCKNLQKLELRNLGGSSEGWCYKEGLYEMLLHCRNLRQFSINQRDIGQAPEMFALLLNNPQLKRVSMMSVVIQNSVPDLISSIERLLYRCTEFTTFRCTTGYTTSAADYDDLRSAVLRWKSQFSRRNLQIEISVYLKSGRSVRGMSIIQ